MPQPHNYSLTGTGSTTDQADASLTRAQGDLAAKLGVNQDALLAISHTYTASYVVRDGVRDTLYGSDEFKVKRNTSWAKVIEVASSKEDLSLFVGRYEVQAFFDLPKAQLAKLDKKPPTAGREDHARSTDVTRLLTRI